MEARRSISADHEWLAERKSLLQKIKSQVQLYLGPEPTDIRNYAMAYKKDIERPWCVSSLDKLHSTIEQTDVVFGGDFHSYAQAQRAHLRILRKIDESKKILLAVEAIPSTQQSLVDLYISGQKSEEEFLKEADWEANWGFPWKFYKPIFDFAKKRGVPILALNKKSDGFTEQTLKERDQFAAELIKKAHLSKQQDLVYVIYGDLHIAEEHLPRDFLNHFPSQPPNIMSIYLNPEKNYFELVEQGLETKVDVIEFKNNQFCILSSPPWVKWQNYLMYLEENYDFGLDEDGDEDDEDDEIDFTDHVLSLVRLICKGVGVTVDTNDIEVYTSKEPQALLQMQKILNSEDFEMAQFLVQNDSSFYVPSHGFFYLSKGTVNHAATLAAQYIHAKLTNRTNIFWSFPQDFLSLIWVEAMGFLMSKWINPKRKSQTLGDLKKQLAAFGAKDEGREPLLFALDQKMSELLYVYKGQSRDNKFVPSRRSSYILAARFLGAMLGERYFQLYHKGQLSREELHKSLSLNPTVEEFIDFYFEQLKFLDRLELEADVV